MKKRIFSWLMAVAMVMSLIPGAAFATEAVEQTGTEQTETPVEQSETVAETGTESTGTEPTYVAFIDTNTNGVMDEGETGHATLADAVAAATPGQTVTLLKNVTVDSTVDINKAIILDGNEHEIDGTASPLLKLSSTANITVQNAKLTTTGNVVRWGYVNDNYTHTYSNCQISGGVYGIHYDGNSGGKIVIDGCTIDGFNAFAGSLKLVTVMDTTFDANQSNYAGANFWGNTELKNVTLVDEGKTTWLDVKTVAEVTGGKVVQNGTEVSLESYLDAAAKIGTTYYGTLPAAIEAAQSGDTVTLLENATGSGVVFENGDNVTIDLNGNTYTLSESVGSSAQYGTVGFYLWAGSTATIKNGTINMVEDQMGDNITFFKMFHTYGDLTLTDVTLDCTNGVAYNGSQDAGFIAVESDNGTVVLNGSTSITNCSSLSPETWTVTAYNKGNVSIDTTGTIDGVVAAYKSTASVKIVNGTFTNSNDTYDQLLSVNDGAITVVGGTFSSDPSAVDHDDDAETAAVNYVADGYKAVGEGPYTVIPTTSYLVTFDPNGGAFAEIGNSTISAFTHELESLPTASRSGYTFNGWFTAASGGTKVTDASAITADTTLYAQWTIIPVVEEDDDDDYYVPVTPSNPTVDKETTENADGSTTTTETKKDGTVIETTENTDGSTVTTETKTEVKETATSTTTTTTTETKTEAADGTVETVKTEEKVVETATSTTTTTTTETKTDAKTETVEVVEKVEVDEDGNETVTTTSTTETKLDNGSTGTTNVAADGTVTAEATVTTTAVTEAAKEETVVTLPIASVPVTTETETAPIVEINIPAKEENVTVEIPVENVTPGTVVVLVDEDGNETVVNTTGTTENGVVVTIEGDVTVKVVDNSKDFKDVTGDDWYSDAADFASSRELMNGMTEDTFGHDVSTSRAMVAQILHNMEGKEDHNFTGSFNDVDEDDWHADAVHWAADNNIISGTGNGNFDPMAAVTREQLAVMLWKYSGSEDSDHYIGHFNDDHEISAWAETAMRWAVEHGLMSGKGNGQLDPQGEATRAEVASVLMNFYKNVKY